MADAWSLLSDAIEALHQRFAAYSSPNTDLYKHALPRLIEGLGPPDFAAPKHFSETLAAHGFSSWPSEERAAVLRALECILHVGQTDELNEAFEALFSSNDLSLESHCKSTPRPPSWASGHGFAHVEWLEPDGALLDEPPVVTQTYTLRVGSPFHAVCGVPFKVLWLPPLVALNGWEQGYSPMLATVREVSCVLKAEMDRHREGAHESARLRVQVLGCRDPFSLAPAGSAALDGFLLSGSKDVVTFGDRSVITRSLQGDINFAYYLKGQTLALVSDTSICQNFFYAGPAVLSEAQLKALHA